MARRSSRTAVIATVATLTLLGAATGWAAVDTPWAQSDANAAHSRSNATESKLSTTTVASASYLRSVVSRPSLGLDPGCDDGLVATPPAVVGGHMYAVVSDHLKAFDLTTGTQLWDLPLDTDSTSVYVSIAVAGGRVFVGAHDCLSQSDPNGYIWAASASTGALLWTTPGSPAGGTLNQLVVSGAFVVASSGGAAASDPYVSVRRASTGASVWFRTTCPGGFIESSALVVASKVVYSTCDVETGATPALSAAALGTGVVAWTRPVGWSAEVGDTDLSSTAHHLFVHTATTLTDLNPATGATRYSITGTNAHALAVDATRLYATCSAGICAYTRATGAFLWSADPGSPVLSVANGVVYTADGSALRATTGALLATLWAGLAQRISVGDGYVAAVTDGRIIDLYGLAGE